MKKKVLKKVGYTFFAINIVLLIISFSISFAVLFRPFYYYHINSLNLVEETNYSYEVIKASYDDVLDYLVFNKEFSVGNLKYSNEGKDHFKDCKLLFTINFIVFLISLIIEILRRIYFKSQKILKHSIPFWSSIILLSIFIFLLTTTIIMGFDNMFELFHSIFFMGKDNWQFSPIDDEIIQILPIEYFRNCAILIVLLSSIISIIFIILDIIKHKKVDIK